MSSHFNYYATTLTVMTAARAKQVGLNPSRSYGYVVACEPKQPGSTSPHPTIGVLSWCATKDVAKRRVQEDNEAKTKGYHGCPHGCEMQARGCAHGIPISMKLSPIPD